MSVPAKNDYAGTLDAYELWAQSYPPHAHNPLMRAEQQAMLARWPETVGLDALDLACGSGRYTRLLVESGAARIVATDFSASMLRQVSTAPRVRASMMHLPFASASFGIVICGLALGHAPAFAPWASEIARVLDERGTLLYSDFHPAAAQAGFTRSFKDRMGRKLTLPHRSYGIDEQRAGLGDAGFTVESLDEVRAGIELQETFEGSADFYDRWYALPIVLVVRARK